MEVLQLELSEYTEDQSEELLFNNRKWLCGDLGLQLHQLRKVQNLRKVLCKLLNKDVAIYPFINSVKHLLYEQGSSNSKQDTWELSYKSICYILFHYDIELQSVTNNEVNVVVTVDPIDKLRQTIANNKEDIKQLDEELLVLQEQKDYIESRMYELKDEIQELRDENNEKLKLINQLEQLL